MPKKKTSEFGAGFVYNLILFAKHYERLNSYDKTGMSDSVGLWFNGAGDHFFELEVPKEWEKKKIGKLAKSLQQKVLSYRLYPSPLSKKHFKEVFEELEELALLIDEELGLEPITADWN